MAGHVLGNYHHILTHYLIPNIAGKTVIDLGCLDGKWIIPMTWQAKKIIAVDILPEGFEKVKEWPGYKPEQIEFYLTKGYELEGIQDGSIDTIFSMDTFPRTEIEVIDKYLGEFKRVLAPGGNACIHLPCSEQPLSHELGFTQLTREHLWNLVNKHGISNVTLDMTTINHGLLLLINM
jgi:ubiquinone/menaquinone biosynthesis C-methylase UbiE